MNFKEYEDASKETDLDNGITYYHMGLAEECGEVMGIRKRMLRGEGSINYDKLRDEFGDVLWYLTRLAAKYNMSLDEIATRNIEKLQDRLARGVIKGSGSNR